MTARIRVAMYLFTIASNDVESQRRGIVVLVLPAKRSGGSAIKPKKRGVNRLEKKFHEAIPMRIAAIHARSSDICSHDLDWIRVVRAMGTMNVIRLKLYCDGTSKDIKNDLTGFGIPFGAIPNANENLMGRWKWVETRKRIEEMQREAANGTVDIKILECPGLKDVIFQTAGKSWALHPGDVFYRSLIEFSHAQHSTSNQTGKKILVNGIVDLIESRNGRFLACDDRGFWVQLENRKDIRKKVALSLRNFNVLSKKRRAGGPKGKKTCVKKGRSRRIVVEL